MYKIAIVDDDKMYLNRTLECIRNFSNSFHIIFDITLYDKSETLNDDIWNHIPYDIYLLDIEMPKIDGLKLAEFIRDYNKMAIIIFISSYMQYSIKGYEYSAFRYICKDTLEKKLPCAISEAVNLLSKINSKSYLISNSKRFDKILYEDILYIYKTNKNSIFVTKDNEYPVRKSLKTVYQELSSEEFVMIERGFILNIIYLQKLNSTSAILLNGTELPVSTSQFKNLLKKLNHFWSKKYDDTI